MPSDVRRQPTPAAQVAPVEEERGDSLVWIGAIVALLSNVGVDVAGSALALSRESVQALALVVPAALAGAIEIRPGTLQRAEGNSSLRRVDRLVAVVRGALVGASLAVLTEAFLKRGWPALERMLASRGESGDFGWALMATLVLGVASARILHSATKRFRK